MEYQKIINLLDDATNQTSKFRTKNCVEMNDESKEKYDNSNIRFKTSITRSNLCDYSDAHVLVKGTKAAPRTEVASAAVNKNSKKVIFKNCSPFTYFITEMNKTQIDDVQKKWYSNAYV